MPADQIFYVGQKAFIRKGEAVLVLILPRGNFDFPGGKIKIGEVDYDSSLRREVYEETGLDIDIGMPFYRWSFELPPYHSHAGQKVFAVGIQCEYKSGGEIKISNEHTSYRWITQDTYKELMDDSGEYQALEAYFKSL